MSIVIEQYAEDMSQLQLLSEEYGLTNLEPVLLGSEEAIAFLDKDSVTLIKCNTGSGSYSIRKRTQKGRQYWYSYKRVSGKLFEAYIGASAKVTVSKLEQVGQFFSSKALEAQQAKDTYKQGYFELVRLCESLISKSSKSLASKAQIELDKIRARTERGIE